MLPNNVTPKLTQKHFLATKNVADSRVAVTNPMFQNLLVNIKGNHFTRQLFLFIYDHKED
jgi:hypothetical protein